MRQVVCVGAVMALFFSGCVGDDGKAVLGGYLQDASSGEGSPVPEDTPEEEVDSAAETVDADVLTGDTQSADVELVDSVEDTVSDAQEADVTESVDVGVDTVSDAEEEETFDSIEDTEIESDASEQDASEQDASEQDASEQDAEDTLEDAEVDSDEEDGGEGEDTVSDAEEGITEGIEGFGTPCSENTECFSGYCIPSAAEDSSMICTVLCVDDVGCSDPSYTCSEFESDELSDIVFLCLPANG